MFREIFSYILPSSSTGHGEFTAKIGAALCIYIPSTASRLEMVVRGAYWISSNSSFIYCSPSL